VDLTHCIQVLKSQYGVQTDLGLRIRKDINQLPENSRTMDDIARIVRKYIGVAKRMLQMSSDEVPQPPEGVVPALAEVLHYNSSVDQSAIALGAEHGAGCMVYSVIEMFLGILLRDYRHYTPRQQMLGYFAIVNQLTSLVSTRHGARIVVTGPPESGAAVMPVWDRVR
jgi:hypothetical protein